MRTDYGNDWNQKGATLSHQSAMREFNLTGEELFEAARRGKLQYRLNNIYGNPFLKLLRVEVEQYVKQNYGSGFLKSEKARSELKSLDKELRCLKRRIRAIEKRKAEIKKLFSDE